MMMTSGQKPIKSSKQGLFQILAEQVEQQHL